MDNIPTSLNIRPQFPPITGRASACSGADRLPELVIYLPTRNMG